MFSVAGENRPVAGCTISRLVSSQNDYCILHFALSAHTSISAETYRQHKLWLVAEGSMEAFTAQGAVRLKTGELYVSPRDIPVGVPTVSNSYLSSVAGWLEFLKQLKFRNKKAAAFGCYGWSGESVKLLQGKLAEAGFAVVDESVRSLWNPEEEDLALVPALVESLLA